MAHGFSKGIPLKKRFGQHFLRSQRVVDEMLDAVVLDEQTNVFEIGCGDGFLTRAILEQPIERLWVFEIDTDWANHVRSTIDDSRMSVFEENILDYDFAHLAPHKPWVLLANLPYSISFPILYMLQRNRHLLKEGVIMIQEEVAKKVVKTFGRGYGYPSLFLQRYFDFKLLCKVPPTAFYPAPKVHSRLMHFVVRETVEPIEQEEQFWKFIKVCFIQPRRTLRNNLMQAHYPLEKFDEALLKKRAQELSMHDFLAIWDKLC